MSQADPSPKVKQPNRPDPPGRGGSSRWKFPLRIAFGIGVAAVLFRVLTPPGDSPPRAGDGSGAPPGAGVNPAMAAADAPGLDDAAREKALHAEAILAVKALLTAFPDNDDAVFLAGLVSHELGDTARAVELWNRALVIDPGRADAWDRLGMALFNDDRYEEAERHFREALKLSPSDRAMGLHLANALFQQGRMEEVVSLLADAPALPAKGWEILGGAHQQLRDYAKAREALEKAVAAEPDSMDAHYALSQVHTRLGNRPAQAEHWKRFEELKARTEEAARTDRTNYSPLNAARKTIAKALTEIGRVHLAYGAGGEAETLWLRAMQVDPGNRDCRFQLAAVAQQGNDLPRALALYEEIRQLTPGDPHLHLAMGHLNVRMNRLKQAAESYVAAIRLRPDDPAVCVPLIELFLRTGAELQRARQLAEHCVGLAPTAPHHALLSRAWAANTNLSAALASIDRALELEPGNESFRKIRQGLQASP